MLTFGVCKDTVKTSINRLVGLGLISKEFKTIITSKGVLCNNVMYVEPVPENIAKITITFADLKEEEKKQYPTIVAFPSNQPETEPGTESEAEKNKTPPMGKVSGEAQGNSKVEPVRNDKYKELQKSSKNNNTPAQKSTSPLSSDPQKNNVVVSLESLKK